MAFVIRQRQIAADNWQLLKPAADGSAPALPADGDVIVPLALWRGQRADLLARSGRLGVWLDGHEDPAEIAGDLACFALVAVNFSNFGDGRGYSIGRLLRERYGYKGELRAIGTVVRDHLYYMAGCGFDSFLMRDGEDPAESLAAFGDFSDSHQATVERPLPLFRRRSGTTASGH